MASSGRTPPRDANGWDGKLRHPKAEEASNAVDGFSPPESENEEGTVQHGEMQTLEGHEIDADEDILDGVPEDETDIDLNHARIQSVPALRLDRFPKLERLCLRQNQISNPAFPSSWGDALAELDLYDNAISHIKNLDNLMSLRSLDLSFNNIKHIKNISHLTQLTDLYFVQNKISKIEGLEMLVDVTNLELAANRIREIENLEKLQKLKQLWLGKNKITELKNLEHFPDLTILSIQSNRLTSPSLSHLSTINLPNLTELYISHNALDSLEPLSGSTNLRTLDISSNPITSLRGLEPLVDLEELWASDCQLESFEEMREVLGYKEGLTTVYFEGNPLQRRKREVYRTKVRLALPRVSQIDATFVRVE